MYDVMKDSRHGRLATKVLDEVAEELREQDLPVFYDETFPFHVMTADLGPYVSLWCGGFTKRIDIMPLCRDGTPDLRYKDKSYLTPKGAVNYVNRFLEKKSKELLPR